MLRTMITASNTLNQLQQKLDVISNNVANVNTVGYKTKEATFTELLYQQYNNDKLDTAVRQSPVGIRYGVGAKIGQIQSNQKQGNLQTTNRDLDFALTKEKQYFNIIMADNNADGGYRMVYTRQGNFYLTPIEDGQVMLVNGDGYPVSDSNGNAIYFPDNVKSFSVSEDGTLNVAYPDGDTLTVQLGITEILKPQLMEHISDTYIGLPNNFNELQVNVNEVLMDLQGANRQNIGIVNGALESSNVDLSKEMTDLIQTQRSYQFNSRAITLADQMLGLINNIR